MNDPNQRMRVSQDGGMEVSEVLAARIAWVRRVQVSVLSLPAKFDFHGDLYRGVQYRYAEGHFAVNAEIALYTFKSFTIDKDLMEEDTFCGQTGDRTIFIIRNGNGKLIAPLSEYPREGEVLV